MLVEVGAATTARPKTGFSVLRLVASGALITAWLFLMPFSPAMPTVGIDPSAIYALNEAVGQGKVFGRDVIFTFGPLASVYWHLYSPAIDTIMMVGSAVYASAICAMLGLAAYPQRLFMVLAVPIIVALCVLPDPMFIILPFSLLLNIVRTGLPSESRLHLPPSIPVILAISVATIAVGIEPVIKGSFIGAAFAVGFLGFIVLLLRNWRSAIAFAVLLGLSLVGAWKLTGQPLRALPYFFAAQAQIISGYTEAMSLHGGLQVPLVYIAASAVILLSAYWQFAPERRVLQWGIVAGLAWILFIGFKDGFVRLEGHVFISAGLLLLVAYLVCAISTRKVALAIGVIGIAGYFIIVGTVSPVSAPVEWVWQISRTTVDGVITRVGHPEALRQLYSASIEKIRAEDPLPQVEGTVDVYPSELSAIFANNLRWSGRPVFQSYLAYTPDLQAKNVAHLVSARAPDTVFFTFSPIDGRLPALEDSQSLLQLLSTYRITAYAKPDYVRMDRAPGPNNAQLREGEERSLDFSWNQDIPVASAVPMWVTIDARPSLIGDLVLSAFKLPQLEIDLTLRDGSVVRRRFIASIGRSGFIISPYLATAADVVRLAAGLSSPFRVKSFKLVTHSLIFWKPDIAVRLTPISITRQASARALVITQPSLRTPIALSRPIQQAAAQCAVDFVNAEPYRPALTHRSDDGTLRLQGWTAPPANVQSNSMSTWVGLGSPNGKTQYFMAKSQYRPDVATALKRPALGESGFDITLDLSAHPGRQTIKLLSVSGEAAYECSKVVDVE